MCIKSEFCSEPVDRSAGYYVLPILLNPLHFQIDLYTSSLQYLFADLLKDDPAFGFLEPSGVTRRWSRNC